MKECGIVFLSSRAIRFALAVLVLSLAAVCAQAQLNPDKTALSKLEKGKYAQAEKLLRKSLSKDSLNPAGRYVYSRLWFTPGYAYSSPDSAYRYAMGAIRDYRLLETRGRERLARFPIDSAILYSLKRQIDSATFLRARRLDSEKAYIEFLMIHTDAQEVPLAVEFRDEAAFRDAEQVNTYQAYKEYVEKYPEAKRAREAYARYDFLIYESRTADGKLTSYEAFLREFPGTPYRNEAEWKILELSTLGGRPADFERFMKTYPKSNYTPVARNIWFHIAIDDAGDTLPGTYMNDSLKGVVADRKGALALFVEKGRYGYFNESGKVAVPAQFREVNDTDRCELFTADLVVTPSGLFTRQGEAVWKGKVDDFEDLGSGFVYVESGEGLLIHKSGRVTAREIDDARVIGHRALAIRRSGRWSVLSLLGVPVTDYPYDNVEEREGIIVLTIKNQKHLILPADIAQLATQPVPNKITADEIQWWPEGIWRKSGNKEGVVTYKLTTEVPLENQVISRAGTALIARSPVGYKVLRAPVSVTSKLWSEFIHRPPWVALKSEGQWTLWNQRSGVVTQPVDSLLWEGPFPVGVSADTTFVFGSASRPLAFLQNVTFTAKDVAPYLLISTRGKRFVYDTLGNARFEVKADKLTYLAEDIFIFESKGRKGLMSGSGKVVLGADYDAIVYAGEGNYSLLKDRMFGLADLRRGLLIKPAYERNITAYSRNVKVAYRGGYGFLAADHKPLSDFTWEEVRYWSDSVALVKKNYQWILWDIHAQRPRMSGIRTVHVLRDTEEEKLAVIQQESNVGVISNRRGVIIPVSFTRVHNLGTPDDPFYMTVREVEEASIHVVIYYDRDGRQIRRDVLENADYELLECNPR
jgi:hypothetical protein